MVPSSRILLLLFNVLTYIWITAILVHIYCPRFKTDTINLICTLSFFLSRNILRCNIFFGLIGHFFLLRDVAMSFFFLSLFILHSQIYQAYFPKLRLFCILSPANFTYVNLFHKLSNLFAAIVCYHKEPQ